MVKIKSLQEMMMEIAIDLEIIGRHKLSITCEINGKILSQEFIFSSFTLFKEDLDREKKTRSVSGAYTKLDFLETILVCRRPPINNFRLSHATYNAFFYILYYSYYYDEFHDIQPLISDMLRDLITESSIPDKFSWMEKFEPFSSKGVLIKKLLLLYEGNKVYLSKNSDRQDFFDTLILLYELYQLCIHEMNKHNDDIFEIYYHVEREYIKILADSENPYYVEEFFGMYFGSSIEKEMKKIATIRSKTSAIGKLPILTQLSEIRNFFLMRYNLWIYFVLGNLTYNFWVFNFIISTKKFFDKWVFPKKNDSRIWYCLKIIFSILVILSMLVVCVSLLTAIIWWLLSTFDVPKIIFGVLIVFAFFGILIISLGLSHFEDFIDLLLPRCFLGTTIGWVFLLATVFDFVGSNPGKELVKYLNQNMLYSKEIIFTAVTVFLLFSIFFIGILAGEVTSKIHFSGIHKYLRIIPVYLIAFIESMVIGLVFVPIILSVLFEWNEHICSQSVFLIFLTSSSFALFFGLISQLLWEDKSVTEKIFE